MHRVPFTDAMLVILHAQLGHNCLWVVPGRKYGRQVYNMTMLKVMRDLGLGHFVPHGFLSTFRDWATECTNFPQHVCEMSLAHAIGNRLEVAYRRGVLFGKRRELMEAWSVYAHFATTNENFGDAAEITTLTVVDACSIRQTSSTQCNQPKH